MATYNGAKGIEALRKKIQQKSELLVSESAAYACAYLVDQSPLGVPYYRSRTGGVFNDVGDYKNNWTVSVGVQDNSVRRADPTGAGAIADAISKGKSYKLGQSVSITNNAEHAANVEYGWLDNPLHGWKAKAGYGVLTLNTPVVVGIFHAVAAKLSKT